MALFEKFTRGRKESLAGQESVELTAGAEGVTETSAPPAEAINSSVAGEDSYPEMVEPAESADASQK